jgi:hypothetical protein
MGDLSACKSKRTLIQLLTVNTCAYISMFILLTAYSTAGRKLRIQRLNS